MIFDFHAVFETLIAGPPMLNIRHCLASHAAVPLRPPSVPRMKTEAGQLQIAIL